MMINIVILSNTANESIHKMTQECIDSIHSTCSANIVVVETNVDGPDFNCADKFCINEPFNFNRFLNFGINYCLEKWPESNYTVLANNDLVFHPNWFESMEPHFDTFDSLCPKSPGWFNHRKFKKGAYEGWEIGHEFTGWCIVLKTNSLKALLPLDEQFEFWFADNDMAQTMKRLGMRNAIIAESHVTHLMSRSYNLVKNMKQFTINMALKFDKKWGN